jgi:hypothetical protein
MFLQINSVSYGLFASCKLVCMQHLWLISLAENICGDSSIGMWLILFVTHFYEKIISVLNEN